MRPISEIKANYRLRVVSSGEDGFAAYINHPCYKPTAIAVIASWGGGWEHVSVSLARRCPTWEEMCMVKDIFWERRSASSSSIRHAASTSTGTRTASTFGRKSARSTRPRRKNTSDERRPRQ